MPSPCPHLCEAVLFVYLRGPYLKRGIRVDVWELQIQHAACFVLCQHQRQQPLLTGLADCWLVWMMCAIQGDSLVMPVDMAPILVINADTFVSTTSAGGC